MDRMDDDMDDHMDDHVGVQRYRRRHRALRVSIAVTALLAGSCSGDDTDASPVTVTYGSLPPPATSIDDGSPVEETGPTSTSPDIAASTTSSTELAEVSIRLDVPPQFLGFAGTQDLTGGMGHDVVVVTTRDDSGPGSYREAMSGGDRIVRFDPGLDGATIHLQTPVKAPGSNVTLDGSGVDVVVQGHATRFSGTNIVVAGMTFRYNDDVNGDDAITFRDAEQMQVAGLFGNSFEQAADGLVDVIWNGGNDVYLTMCGNSFAHHDKAVLIDSGDDTREGGRYHVTMCRNWWNDVYQRAPLSRRALVHQFNSLFERYGEPGGNGGGSKAGGDGEDSSQHLLENNMAIPRRSGEQTFDGTSVTQPRTEWAGVQLESDGAVRALGTWLGSVEGVAATEVTARPESVFDPPYEYPLVAAGPELAAVLRVTAGSCRPVDAVRVSPCAPLVLVDDPGAFLDVLVEGQGVESVVVTAGRQTITAERVDDVRWRVPIAALGDGPVEVRAEAQTDDGRTISSDVAVVAVVP